MAGEIKKDKSKLSKRELDVLRAVAKGLSNQEVGRELVISENTVRVHLRKIYAKLEVQSRTEATMRAIQDGIIDMPGNESTAASAESSPTQPIVPDIPTVSPQKAVYFFGTLLVALAVLFTPYWRNLFYRPAQTSILDHPVNTTDPAVLADLVEQWQQPAEMPSARSRMGVATLGNKLYIIGGERTSGTTGLVEIYDSVSNQWQEGSGKPTAVANVQAVPIGTEIYVPGGCTSETTAISTLEVYSPADNSWRTGAPMPAKRCAYAAVAFGEKIMIVGGWDGAVYKPDVFVYSTITDSWETLGTPYPKAVGFAGAALQDGLLVVAGGYDGMHEYADVFQYSFDTGEWEPLPSLNTARGGLGLVSLGDSLYAVGGGWTHPVSSNEQWSPDTNTWSEIDTPNIGEWRNLGLATIDRKIYAVGGWNGGYMNSVFSYKTVYKVFIPLSY